MSFASATIIRSISRGAANLRSRLAGGVCLAAVSLAPAAAATPFPVSALGWLDTRSAVGSAVVAGVLMFATVLAIMYLRERRLWTNDDRVQREELTRLQAARDRSDMLLSAERQVVVTWAGPDADPVVDGDASVTARDGSPTRVTAFGTWLTSPDAGRLEAAMAQLRERGEAFSITVQRLDGAFIDAEGRAVVGQAMLRLRDSTAERAELLASRLELDRLAKRLSEFEALLGGIDVAVWLRDAGGRLSWVNRAYAELLDMPAAAGQPRELMNPEMRREAEARRLAGETFRSRVGAVVGDARRLMDVMEIPIAGGAGGIARDMSEIEQVSGSLDRRLQAQGRTLDQLPIAVAGFDAGQRLVFHNTAYARLWRLDPAFLAAGPTEGEILDRLRTSRSLPEQADYRSWRRTQLAGYGAAVATDNLWHLPDRRVLQVVAQPDGAGGLTYLFDDATERMQLEMRHDSLIRTQRETLDTLSEGVALFGSDGRLKLFNDAMVRMWRLDRPALEGRPHIDAVVALCRTLAPEDASWADVRAAVSGLVDRRERLTLRLSRVDGSILDCAAEPLPDGATLLTFGDVTATVNVERALTERAAALESAGKIRDEFVHHVSYELRSPLTTVIGFAELLAAETVGPLNDRQREYAGHITRSSGALLAIVNDILDLASIDTETITLTREPVDVRRTIEAAALGIESRLAEAELKLDVDLPPEIGSFEGDAKRVRQIVYNLLSNAAGFSARGQTIRVAARKGDGEVVISVSDQGAGIPQHVQDRVFDRFESHGAGSGHRGVGLGLSIVRSFVELHGGHVELVSELGSGTTVTCYFPTDGQTTRQLAAEIPHGASS